MEKVKVFTPSIIGFYENIGRLKDIRLYETTLDTKFGEIILFTGSILDKSEIDYRRLTMSRGRYFTVIPECRKKEDVDKYWHMKTEIVYKLEVERYLRELFNKHQ